MIKREQNSKFLKIQFVIIIVCVSFLTFCKTEEKSGDTAYGSTFPEQRKQMVEEQIKKRGIKDPKILAAFRKVPRHHFVPDHLQHLAYKDRPLPIGDGQTISQPYIVAYMTAILDVSETDKVLEIGTGSGYQAAILAELCDSVFTMEINQKLGARAKKLLRKMDYNTIQVKIGDGYQGWPEYAPFDAIIVTCSPSEIPEPLKNQLAEGGRIIIPVGRSSYQYLVYLTKINNQIKEKKVLPVMFVPMVDSTGSKY
ncbi:MAG: protein-L-isoaspartate(D-aspartate) O-methyltransferase [Fidelibacterota bacterium]